LKKIASVPVGGSASAAPTTAADAAPVAAKEGY